jgi:hypothetical protein
MPISFKTAITSQILLLRRLALTLIVLTAIMPAESREPWQMKQPPGEPPQKALLMPGGAYSGMVNVPQDGKDFWQQAAFNRVPVGTVLSGTLEEDLSSETTVAGQYFGILLEDGFEVNGYAVIPPRSRILGVVTLATPAKLMRHGHSGSLQVSLTSLVFPDGRNFPFSGFIDHNPNLQQREVPKSRYAGQDMRDYGQSVKSMFGQFTSGLAPVLNARSRGNDFGLQKGSLLPIRLNRSLDLMAAHAVVQNPAYKTQVAQWQAKSMAQASPAVPGLVGPDPDNPAFANIPVAPTGYMGKSQSSDPNNVFNIPIQPAPLSQMADPF